MRLINLMYDLVTCLTTTPLRLLSVFGSVIALAGFASVLLVVLRLVFGPQWAAEGVFMLFAVLFMFIGAQFVGMGLLGEYIGRIYNDVRARPRYFIQRVVRQETKQHLKRKIHESCCLCLSRYGVHGHAGPAGSRADIAAIFTHPDNPGENFFGSVARIAAEQGFRCMRRKM
jgi:hypothetical protein